MSKLRKFIEKRVGRRNLPFVGAVIVLLLIVILLMYLSPKPYSDRGTAMPSTATTE